MHDVGLKVNADNQNSVLKKLHTWGRSNTYWQKVSDKQSAGKSYFTITMPKNTKRHMPRYPADF